MIVSARWGTYPDADPEALLEFLQTHARHVLLVEQPPELTINTRIAKQWLCYRGITPQAGTEQCLPVGDYQNSNQRGRKNVHRLAKQYANCVLLPTYDFYARHEGEDVLALDGPNVVFYDWNHLTDYGTHLAERRFEEAIDELVPPR